jgi:biotin transport system substrate-specific component
VLAVAIFATLTALAARTAVPLPGGVPVSLQTLVVITTGLLIGPALGATAMASYLAAGIAGLPVFTAGAGAAYLFGPTGGYLLAFPVAAAVAGIVARQLAVPQRSRVSRVGAYALAALAATATVYAGGWSQLAALTGDGATAFRLGVLPFIIGDAIKIVLAVAIADRLRRRTLGLL